MAKGRRKKAHLTDDAIRKRVDKVMEQWQSYPSFAALLDALLNANDNCSDREFANALSNRSGRDYSETAVDQIRSGTNWPTYQFVNDLLDSDALRLGDDAVRPSGSRRALLFEAAGFIETTPDAVRQWNRKVLADLRKAVSDGKPLLWGDVITKLFDFQAQGGQLTRGHLANRAFPEVKDNVVAAGNWIGDFLSNRRTATREKREAIARAVGLDDDQIDYLERLVQAGDLLVTTHRQVTLFRHLLCDALSAVKAHGFTPADVGKHGIGSIAEKASTLQGSIYDWRQGRSLPTLEGLRGLIRGLAKCLDQDAGPLLSRDQLDRLVVAAGFQPQQLVNTTHDIIAAINDSSEVTSLLQELRMAMDVSVPLPMLVAMNNPERQINLPSVAQVNQWEHSNPKSLPSLPQVRELLERYQAVIAANGGKPLTTEEIAGVMKVAERSLARWKERAHVVSIQRHRQVIPRERLSPGLDEGTTR